VLPPYLEWKMQAACSSERLLHIWQTTPRHFPEDRNIDIHSHENLKYHIHTYIGRLYVPVWPGFCIFPRSPGRLNKMRRNVEDFNFKSSSYPCGETCSPRETFHLKYTVTDSVCEFTLPSARTQANETHKDFHLSLNI
jgi:hypothetical protein